MSLDILSTLVSILFYYVWLSIHTQAAWNGFKWMRCESSPADQASAHNLEVVTPIQQARFIFSEKVKWFV